MGTFLLFINVVCGYFFGSNNVNKYVFFLERFFRTSRRVQVPFNLGTYDAENLCP